MADNNIKKISFFTPVAFQKKNKSFGRKLAEKCDSYLSLRGRKAEVLHSKDARHHEVKITEGKRNLWLTTAKIMSYFTLVVPFLALLGKLAFRSYYQFSVQPIKETPPNIQETAKKAEPVKATATWENAAAAQKDEYKKLEKKRLDVKRAERVPGEEKAEKKEELDPTQTQDTSGSEGSEEQTEETEKKETRSPPETAEISEDESSDSETESSESDPLELFDTEENSQKLGEIYKAVEDCHNQSKKYVVFKNDHFVVAKGKQKPAEKEEAFNKIVHIIRKSIEHNVDRFVVTETVEEKTSKEKKTSKKEVSIYALLEKLFSSKLGEKVIRNSTENGRLKSGSSLAELLKINIEVIKKFSEDLANKLNIVNEKGKGKASRGFFRNFRKKTTRQETLCQKIQEINYYGKVALRCLATAKHFEQLPCPKPERVSAENFSSMPEETRKKIIRILKEIYQTEKTFSEHVKKFTDKKKWPEVDNHMTLFEALAEVGAITEEEKLLISQGWKQLSESAELLRDGLYKSLYNSEGEEELSPEEKIAKCFQTLSPEGLRNHLANIANGIAKYSETAQILHKASNNEKGNLILENFSSRTDNPGKLDYNDILITPVQRAPRYCLLVAELLKNLPESWVKLELSKSRNLIISALNIINPMLPEMGPMPRPPSPKGKGKN